MTPLWCGTGVNGTRRRKNGSVTDAVGERSDDLFDRGIPTGDDLVRAPALSGHIRPGDLTREDVRHA